MEPIELNVLLVDDDPEALMLLEHIRFKNKASCLIFYILEISLKPGETISSKKKEPLLRKHPTDYRRELFHSRWGFGLK